MLKTDCPVMYLAVFPFAKFEFKIAFFKDLYIELHQNLLIYNIYEKLAYMKKKVYNCAHIIIKIDLILLCIQMKFLFLIVVHSLRIA